MGDIAILAQKQDLANKPKVQKFLQENGIEIVVFSDFQQTNQNARIVLDFRGENQSELLKDEEKLIEWMTLKLGKADSEKYEVLECVDPTGEPTGDFVNRHWFYSGNCINKHICGVVFWIFDDKKNLLLAKRGTEKEQGGGKISPPSGHVQYGRDRADNNHEGERPLIACFKEIEEELGLPWNYDNFRITDDYFPVGVIERPGKSGEGCTMVVKHYALMLKDESVKAKIQNNEAVRIGFEPWNEAKKNFGKDDNTHGEYKFFGTNKQFIMRELEKFVNKIELIKQLGKYATWDTYALSDWEAIEKYKSAGNVRNPRNHRYVDYEVSSWNPALEYHPWHESNVFDHLHVKSGIRYEDIMDFMEEVGKVIVTGPELQHITGRNRPAHNHNPEEYGEIAVLPHELDALIERTRTTRGYVRVEHYKSE